MVLLIGGHQRSGTTMLCHLCNSHPDITVTREFANFMPVGNPFATYKARILKQWWERNKFRYWVRLSPPPAKPWKRWTRTLAGHVFTMHYLFALSRSRHEPVDVQTIGTVLRALFPSARIVGDKWPDYIFMLDTFAPLPEVACVMIYRDCRDVASSHLKLARTNWRQEPWIKNADTAEKIANRWVRALELIERHQDRIHAIRYEDLVQNRQQTLDALGHWLGVDPKGFRQDIVRDTSIGKFKVGLSDEEVATVLKIAGPTMARHGYL